MGIRSVAQDNQTTRIANQRCENLLISLIEKNIFKNQMAFYMPMQRSLMNSTRSNAYYAIIASELKVVPATKYG